MRGRVWACRVLPSNRDTDAWVGGHTSGRHTLPARFPPLSTPHSHSHSTFPPFHPSTIHSTVIHPSTHSLLTLPHFSPSIPFSIQSVSHLSVLKSIQSVRHTFLPPALIFSCSLLASITPFTPSMPLPPSLSPPCPPLFPYLPPLPPLVFSTTFFLPPLLLASPGGESGNLFGPQHLGEPRPPLNTLQALAATPWENLPLLPLPPLYA